MLGIDALGRWTRGLPARLVASRVPRRALLAIAGLLVGTWLVLLAADLYAEWLWFEHLGHAGVLATRLIVHGLLFLSVGLTSLAALWGNVALARRLVRRQERLAATTSEDLWDYVARIDARLSADDRWARLLPRTLLVAGAVLAVVLGLLAAGRADVALRLLYATPFGIAEPLSGRDVGFYVFVLPAARALLYWLLLLALAAAVGTTAVYLALLKLELGLGPARALSRLGQAPRLHLATLAASVFLLLAAAHQVALAELVLTPSGQAGGIDLSGYTNARARGPALWLMTAAAIASAALVLLAASRRGRIAAWGLGAYAATLLFGLLLPPFVQAFIVLPNEPERERPFIAELIRATRQAYGLAGVREQSVQAADAPNRAPLDGLTGAPLWDRVALRDALNQLQAFRPYYHFFDVDVDRYPIDGRQRQVMVAARELRAEALPARTWTNTHVQFTHGYGAVVALAGGVVGEGAPSLVVQDLPPAGQLPIRRPEIFYGEATDSYALVGARESVAYEGRGIGVDGLARRLVFALSLRDPNLLLTDLVTPETMILYHRRIADRIARLAPFLLLDPDPYLVLADGGLFWMVDAYTWTDHYPLSYRRPFGTPSRGEPPARPRPDGVAGPSLNYLRNSVKVVVDAYGGGVRFYLADPDDPIARTYAAIYPSLFEPLDAMAPSLRTHLRYPQQLFALQADVLARFHVQDPLTFYYGEEIWQLAREKFEARVTTRPQYVLMRLPSEAGEELLLVQPFTPFSRANDKHNLTAVLLARSDPPHAGQLVLQRYSRDRLVEGPFQVELRIEQDPGIAAQFGLWQRAGLLVFRSSMVTLPLGPTPLYVESIYLQRGTHPTIPELKRVILALGNQLVMEPTFGQALAKLTGRAPAESSEAPRSAEAADGDPATHFRALQERLQRAQEALASGDRARYAEELAAIQAELRRLEELTGR